MGLIIERHPSDVIIKAKMTVSVDKKGKYKLGAGDKVDIPLSEGKHTISVSLANQFLLTKGKANLRASLFPSKSP